MHAEARINHGIFILTHPARGRRVIYGLREVARSFCYILCEVARPNESTATLRHPAILDL